MSLADKRKFPRFSFREAVQVHSPEQPVIAGSVGYDLSEEGIRFRTEEFIPLQAEIMLTIQLKIEREATLSARVVWAQKAPHMDAYYVGCEFFANRENVFPKLVIKNFLEHQAA